MDELMDFQCPACGAKLRAPHMAAGRPGRCTKCQKEFIVPAQFAMDSGPAAAAPPRSAAPTPMINPFERPAAKPKPKPGLGDAIKPLIPGAIAVVLLAVGGWFLWSYFTAGDEEGHPAAGKEGTPSEEDQRQAAQQAEHERQQAAEKAAQALELQEKAKHEAAAAAATAAAAAAAAAPQAAAVPAPAPSAAPPAVTMSKKEAEQLVAGGKIAMQDAASDPSRALAAAVAFSKAVPYYEATGEVDQVCDLEANIFWCKKRMTGESIKVLIAQKTGDDVFKQALDRVDAVAAKEIPKGEAKKYYDRADKFAQDHPDDYEQISVRYFEVAERFAGTDISLQAQKVSLQAQQKQQKRVQTEAEAQRQTLFTKSASGGVGVQSATIPGADAIKSAVAAVRKLFKDDYAKTKPNQRRRLIAKLLEQAPLSKDDPNTQYALLTEAIDLSLAAGDWYATFTACDLMGQQFKGVDARSRKKEVFAKVRANPVVTAIVKLIDAPDDPEANAVAGKYFCFETGKWDIGLPLLARGGDAEYKAAAEMELVRPTGSPQQLELADKWYALGKKAKPGARESMLARAFSWYKQAEPAITGITKQRIAGRIEEIDGLLPMTNLDYENLTPKQWDRLKGALVEISAGKDRNDTGIAITHQQRVRVVPHPTDTWTSDYFNTPITVNWKGYQAMRVGTFTFSGYVAGDFPIGALVMQIEQGKQQKPGIIEGEGRIFIGPYAAGWGAGGMGIIRCKILPVTDDD